ncbi:MAG: YggS family pyridoxal phosphate-dependent enzyme [Planctomycetota bacterium]|nr:MAG: YggS family pyridoxal phosphate-dependent enzyme [Planctomycetota bacterium]
MEGVACRLGEVHSRISAAAARAGRDPSSIHLIAVAKTATPTTLRAAWGAGQRDFGHNRVQALAHHHALLPPEARWHLIGPLQRNKARRALELADLIHTVAGEPLVARLERLLAEPEDRLRPPRPVLVQVNLTPEDGRAGCRREELEPLLERIRAGGRLEVRGLMTLAPAGAPAARLRRHFAGLRELAERAVQAGLLPERPELSMGMSDDFEIAVEEGATLVRVGRAIFPPAPALHDPPHPPPSPPPVPPPAP